MRAYFDFEHFGWPFRQRLYEMPASFVDEFRTVHLTVITTRETARADTDENLSPSERRLRKAKREMERELGTSSAQ